MWGQFEFVLPSPTLVWSTPLGLPRRCGRCMHQHSTSGIRRIRRRIKIRRSMQGCGLTSLVVCINDKFWDIREGNVTIRSEIWITNICALGFQDIRECVTLWSLGCSFTRGGVELPKNRDPSLSSIIGSSQSSLVWAVDGAHPPIQGLTMPRV